MDAMRWTILGVGVLVLLAIYAFGRWRDRRRRRAEQEPEAAAPGSAFGQGGTPGVPGGAEAGGLRADSTQPSVIDDDVLSPGRAERPVIDDDELRGIDDLLAEQEAPDPFDLSLELDERSTAAPTKGQDSGGGRPWWQDDDAAADGDGTASQTHRRSAAAEAERAGLAPADPMPSSAAPEAPADPEPAAPQPDARAADAAPDGEGAPSADAAPAQEAAGEAPRSGTAAGPAAQASGRGAAADEPPPLKLSPASQVEIAAYRSGDVEEAEKILMVFVAARDPERFQGPAIEQALRRVRMVPGERRIWHRRGQSETGGVTLFSVASMVEPGYLDPEQTLPELETPGLIFFMQLPLPVDGEQVLDAMLATAYQVSVELGGELLDSTRSTMTQQIAEHMREQLREHRRRLHIAVHKRQ